MRQKYFTDTIQGKFIKSILLNTALPLYDTILEGDYMIEGYTYIHICDILKCTKSGIFGKDAEHRLIDHYDFGLAYPKFTQKFESTYNYYDGMTHKFLGKYLRCLADIYGIDLMPFYNCWCGDYKSNIHITRGSLQSGEKKNYKVFQVPIKFNKKYTVAFDCQSQVNFAPAFVSKGIFVTAPTNQLSSDLSMTFCSSNPSFVRREAFMSFKNPIIYDTDISKLEDNKFWYRYENYLYLLVQVPVKNVSSFIVLEGDYTNVHCKKVFDVSHIEELDRRTLNNLMLNDLSLLQLNDRGRYPFADRLIEYVLMNVITNRDEFEGNVKFVQSKFITQPNGVWKRNLRKYVYDAFQNDIRFRHLDNNGYVDRDIEKFLLRR